MKKILSIGTNPSGHWVGDGFPVRTLFSYQTHAKLLSPFLMLDYAGPAEFLPSAKPRGVGEHPHRGFETVTIVYQGEVSHRDSGGGGGTIGPGDVQWMTAGAGVIHDEFHSESFTAQGGILEMIQLWVNLPSEHKMTPPKYQAILNTQIPKVPLTQGQSGQQAHGEKSLGEVSVIAGDFDGVLGPAQTFTPMQVLSVKMHKGAVAELPLKEGWNSALIMLHGTSSLHDGQELSEGYMSILSPEGEGMLLSAKADITCLLLSGEPIAEPVVGYGPFVMNTREQIEAAISDFNQGRFGTIR